MAGATEKFLNKNIGLRPPRQAAGLLRAPNALLATLMKLRSNAERPDPERVHRQSQRPGHFLLAVLVKGAVFDN